MITNKIPRIKFESLKKLTTNSNLLVNKGM